MAYLVHHTLNRNGMYTGGKPNPVPFDEKSLTDKSQCKKTSETKENTFFHSKPMEESVILNAQYRDNQQW